MNSAVLTHIDSAAITHLYKPGPDEKRTDCIQTSVTSFRAILMRIVP